ncbi:MAG: hypothetical protein RJA90_279 [Bacteroidota bacterium]
MHNKAMRNLQIIRNLYQLGKQDFMFPMILKLAKELRFRQVLDGQYSLNWDLMRRVQALIIKKGRR